MAMERWFSCGPSSSSAPVPSRAHWPKRPCMMANCACPSRISTVFSPDPAEEIADMSMPWAFCRWIFASVASATPTG
jgi:hypothetical protein